MMRALIALNAPGTSRPWRSLTLARNAARRAVDEVVMVCLLDEWLGVEDTAGSVPIARPPVSCAKTRVYRKRCARSVRARMFHLFHGTFQNRSIGLRRFHRVNACLNPGPQSPGYRAGQHQQAENPLRNRRASLCRGR